MKTQEKTKTTEPFQVEDPVAVFTAFSQEELRRGRDTVPDFSAGLHDEAVALVLERLKKGHGTVRKQGRGQP
ncbi:MAG: hypothetical protein H7835_06825 [Magnetococcus sp. XQGC-1]